MRTDQRIRRFRKRQSLHRLPPGRLRPKRPWNPDQHLLHPHHLRNPGPYPLRLRCCPGFITSTLIERCVGETDDIGYVYCAYSDCWGYRGGALCAVWGHWVSGFSFFVFLAVQVVRNGERNGKERMGKRKAE
jgi:hypothetical protein